MIEVQSRTNCEDLIKEKDKEIERLKQGYCPIKEKCNKGECDCTNEEYNQMCEENIKLDLEIERLNNVINEIKKGLDKFYKEYNRLLWTEEDYIEFINCIDRELKGDDKE